MIKLTDGIFTIQHSNLMIMYAVSGNHIYLANVNGVLSTPQFIEVHIPVQAGSTISLQDLVDEAQAFLDYMEQNK